MSNSNLVTYAQLSPNKTSPRGSEIDTITIHCFVAQVTAKRGCEVFQDLKMKVSSNYVIGYDGSIGLCVEEEDRSWCSSNSENDDRAVTIEVASDNKEPYAVTEKAYAALIDLVTDICRRNGISKLVWSTNKKERINHRNGCNMTVHRDYANKSCPGAYLYERMGKIAAEVNERLTQATAPEEDAIYRVRKRWENASSQLGAFRDLDNAKALVDKNPGYFVYDGEGRAVYPVEEQEKPKELKVGAVVSIAPGAIYYSGAKIPGWVQAKQWIVREVNGNRVVIDRSADGKNAICSPIHKKYLTVV